jgi:hypothetical protein
MSCRWYGWRRCGSIQSGTGPESHLFSRPLFYSGCRSDQAVHRIFLCPCCLFCLDPCQFRRGCGALVKTSATAMRNAEGRRVDLAPKCHAARRRCPGRAGMIRFRSRPDRGSDCQMTGWVFRLFADRAPRPAGTGRQRCCAMSRHIDRAVCCPASHLAANLHGRGRIHPDAHRLAARLRGRGRNHPDAHRLAANLRGRGRIHPDAHRLAANLRGRGRIRPDAHRLAANLRGRERIHPDVRRPARLHGRERIRPDVRRPARLRGHDQMLAAPRAGVGQTCLSAGNDRGCHTDWDEPRRPLCARPPRHRLRAERDVARKMRRRCLFCRPLCGPGCRNDPAARRIFLRLCLYPRYRRADGSLARTNPGGRRPVSRDRRAGALYRGAWSRNARWDARGDRWTSGRHGDRPASQTARAIRRCPAFYRRHRHRPGA